MDITGIMKKRRQNNASARIPQELKEEFKDKVFSINLHRERFTAYVGIIFFLFLLIFDLLYFKNKWSIIPAYKALFYIHISSIAFFTAYTFILLTGVRNFKFKRIMHFAFVIYCLLFSECMALNAQFIHGQISAYIITLFFVSLLLIMNNTESLIIISLSFVTFTIGLVVIQRDPVNLSGNIINTLTLIICAIIISRVNFSMYAKDFLVNKALTEKNRQDFQQKRQLETILENMTEGVIVTDPKGNILFMNSVALRMHGLGSLEEYVNRIYFIKNFDVFSRDWKQMPLEERPISRALRGEAFTDCEMWVCRKDTDLRWLGSYGGAPIHDENGKMIMAVITLRDMTANHRQQEELLNIGREKNEALEKVIEMKDEFLSLISHEFKTPLTVINSAIQAMELICRNELSDKTRGFLNKIRQNSNRQLKLVNNLLDITRMNAGRLNINRANLDIVSVTRSITESIRIFAEQKNIKLSFSSTLVRKIIDIDEEKYERVLLNLLSNAIKFTPEGKSISVSVSQKIIEKKSRVCIAVRDKGVGIPYDKKELIFERFGQVDSSLTRQAEGTGIGLYLVKMLVELMDGEISVESKEGAGSTFSILLPAAKSTETPKEHIMKELTDNRLIQATAIEFSDIYV